MLTMILASWHMALVAGAVLFMLGGFLVRPGFEHRGFLRNDAGKKGTGWFFGLLAISLGSNLVLGLGAVWLMVHGHVEGQWWHLLGLLVWPLVFVRFCLPYLRDLPTQDQSRVVAGFVAIVGALLLMSHALSLMIFEKALLS